MSIIISHNNELAASRMQVSKGMGILKEKNNDVNNVVCNSKRAISFSRTDFIYIIYITGYILLFDKEIYKQVTKEENESQGFCCCVTN